METSSGYTFGELLKQYRARANMSQTALAEKLGVTRLTISNWEVGNTLPRRHVKEIADALLLNEHDTNQLIAASLGHTLVPPWPPADSADAPEDNRPLRSDEVPQVSSDHPPQWKWNRQRMLEKVHTILIKEGLEKLVSSTALIPLGFHEKPDAVTTPGKPISQEGMKQSLHGWPQGTDIGQIYDDTIGELLILGEAGSGKTILLLQLTRILLDRAKRDENHPIPVVFNLSSWVVRRLPISRWLVEELNIKYQVPRKLGQLWVENDHILPLLDGLDEVALSQREACVDALNAYRREHGLLPTVVCSRSTDYLALVNRLQLRGAIILQPLTEQQVDDYFVHMGGQLESMHAALRDDPDLQELVATPLMLNVLTLAYYDTPVEDLQAKNPLKIRRQWVFAAYVQRMLQRRESNTRHTQQQIMHWLTWLAQQLTRRNQSEFYLERMQMDWLPESRLRWLLPGIIVGLVYGLFFGLVKGIDYGLMQGKDQQYHQSFTPSRGFIDGFLIGILNALIFAFLNGFVFGVAGKREREREGSQARGSWWNNLINILEKRPIYGLLFGVLNGLLIGLLVDLPAGLYNGLFISIVYAVLGRLNLEIQPAEVVTWSWIALRQNAFKFVGGGVLSGFFYGLLTGLYWLLKKPPLSATWFLPCLLFGLSIGLVLGILVVLIRGLSHDKVDRRDMLKPNQGIWNSARNSALLGLFCWLLFGLFFGVIYGMLLDHVFQAFGVPYAEYGSFFPKANGLIIGLANGLAVGAFFALRSGGTACIQHLLLRISLWRAKCTPWNYPLFLDNMAERLILRKVGGGYIFVHRLLQDYFVSQGASSASHDHVTLTED